MTPARSTKTCAHVRDGGKPCLALPMTGKALCWFHDPARATELRAARSAGGKKLAERTANVKTLKEQLATAPEVAIEKPRDMLKLLGETLTQVRRGAMDPNTAKAISMLCGVALRVLELMDGGDDERLKKLEEQMRAFKDKPTEELLEIVRASRAGVAPNEH